MLFKYPTSGITDEEIARLAIEAELDAINLYESLARMTKDPLLKETLLDVANEEKTHAGEFLANIQTSDDKYINRGIRELCERAEKMNINLDVCKLR